MSEVGREENPDREQRKKKKETGVRGKVAGVFVIVVPLHWVLLPKENLVALYLLKEMQVS